MSYIPVKDYVVVTAWDISKLELKVNSKLEEGYILIGGVTFTVVHKAVIQYCQALVKRGNP